MGNPYPIELAFLGGVVLGLIYPRLCSRCRNERLWLKEMLKAEERERKREEAKEQKPGS